MKLKINKPKLDRELKLGKTEEGSASVLRDLDSNHIINILEENMKMREASIPERLKNKLKK